MADFKVGGKVICVDDSRLAPYHPIKKGETYVISAISHAPCCGQLAIDIGIESLGCNTRCTKCGRLYSNHRVWWLLASRFLPLEDFQQITYTKIFESVPVGAQ